MKQRKSILLRIDPALHAELEAWAQDAFRSVNGQIEFILREAVAKHRGPKQPPAEPTTAEDERPTPSTSSPSTATPSTATPKRTPRENDPPFPLDFGE